MLHFRSVLYILGFLLMGLGVLMLVPAVADLLAEDFGARIFLLSSLATGAAGTAAFLAFRPADRPQIGVREGFLLTALTWVVLAGFATLPFLMAAHLSFTDAYFEAMSGLTTTGSTTLSHLEEQNIGVLLWRALLQWLGGVGVIVLAVTLLPYLRIGGMQFFSLTGGGEPQGAHARFTQLAGSLVVLYVLLTLICAVALRGAGMPMFDAVCHAMAILSTGGFSTRDAGIAAFHNPAIEWVCIFFMLLGGLTFTPVARLLFLGDRRLFADTQIHWYGIIVLAAVGALATWQILTLGRPALHALRSGAFAAIGVISSTGLVNEDYGRWGPLPAALMTILLFVGGCTGSSAGGIKIFRFCVLGSFAKWQIRSLLHPHRILLPTYNGRKVANSVVRSVISFIAFYMLAFALLSVGVAASGVDVLSAFTGVAQALANVGHGLGPLIGPRGMFSLLPESAKWLLTLAMLLGRLELMAVLVLFSPGFWRA